MKFKDDIIIGLEIHIELDTDTKLFCSCPTKGDEIPNTRTCPICLGMPGSKPVLNKKAFAYAAKLAKALGCDIAPELIFSRKSYFYPDLAKNFQITQYELPLGKGGNIRINNKKINLTRIHIEEDPASLIHPKGINGSSYCLIDYNRSGNPLCEIVTEPDLRSPAEARDFMKELITILTYLKIYDPKHCIIKADCNISIKESGYIRAEIKNISGFKEIERALTYEIQRQKESVLKNEKLSLETRAWDIKKGITTTLRKKESEADYGYIIDTDLVPIKITDEFINSLNIPELHFEKIKKYTKKGIAEDDAKIIAADPTLAALLEETIKTVDPILASKWIRRELMRVMNYNNTQVYAMKDKSFITLLSLLQEKKITENTAQKIIQDLVLKDFDVSAYVKNNSLEILDNSDDLQRFCKEAIKENPKAISDYNSGNANALNFLLGQVMRKAKGKADPKTVKDLILKLLKDN